VAGRDDLIAGYLEGLERELATQSGPHEVDTLFLGGGTPTHLPPDDLHHLLGIAKKWFPLATGYEWSVEANPIDLTPEKREILKAAGVNRVSIGGQSFDAAKLTMLERDHSGELLAERVAACQQQFCTTGLDLIFGVPGETPNVWRADLRRALELRPEHLSTYGLTFERGTSYWSRKLRGELSPLAEETEAEFYNTAIDGIVAAGYEHYEVSNFALPGFRCRHNEAYWLGAEYFAAGPGAARYLNGRREMNHRSTTTWLARVLAGQSPVAETETLEPKDRARERLVFGLRRLEGVNREQFAEANGYEIDSLVGRALREIVEHGLLTDYGNVIRLTRAGLLVSDAIWSKFLRS
jgi:oxygen-independent coproporphyrinogen-3 oxidase